MCAFTYGMFCLVRPTHFMHRKNSIISKPILIHRTIAYGTANHE